MFKVSEKIKDDKEKKSCDEFDPFIPEKYGTYNHNLIKEIINHRRKKNALDKLDQ